VPFIDQKNHREIKKFHREVNLYTSNQHWWGKSAAICKIIRLITSSNHHTQVFLGTALLTYSFPGDWPQQLRGGRFTATLITGLVSTSLLLTAICLSTVVHYR